MLFVVAEILHVVAVALFVLLLYALQVLLLQLLAIEQMQKINFTLVGENFEKLKTLHILSIFYLTYDDNYIYKLLFLNVYTIQYIILALMIFSSVGSDVITFNSAKV